MRNVKIKSNRARAKQVRKAVGLNAMPSWILVHLGAACFLACSYYCYILAEAAPNYIEVANSVPLLEWGAKGWVLTLLLAMTAAFAWLNGTVAKACNDALVSRWFK